ncbi:hypothetical protein RSP824_20170, partial [Ralstonia pseudosolanacearum]
MGQSRGTLGAGCIRQVPRYLQREVVNAEAWRFDGEFGELGRGGLLGAYRGGLHGLLAFAGLLLLAEALFLLGVDSRRRLAGRRLSESETGK